VESVSGFLGINFPPSPRACSPSAGVLGKDRDKCKPDGDGDSNVARSPPAEKVRNRALMERGWPGYNGLPQDKRRVSRATATKLIPTFRQSFIPMELNN